MIRQIDKSIVQQICSGQVIISLESAVKELLENSIDAGSTRIDVSLKRFGADSVEVSDNGGGIKPENFSTLALRHHTSKLSDFADLNTLNTYGFRGEALSSLSSIGELSIITRHQSQEVGAKLSFDASGTLVSNKPFAYQTGSQVKLDNLFFTLPVRRKEFNRNIKREFQKLINTLYCYCLANPSIHFSCTNLLTTGRKVQIINVGPNKSIDDAVACLFGSNQLKCTSHFIQEQPDSETLCNFGLAEDFDCSLFKVCGLISNLRDASGRSSSDRQFLFLNKRPWSNPGLLRVVNEVYRTFNKSRYPFVALDITAESACLDVNVTPDKRTIFVQNEKALYAVVKYSIEKFYEQNAFPLNSDRDTKSNFVQQTINLFSHQSENESSQSSQLSSSAESDGKLYGTSFSNPSISSKTSKLIQNKSRESPSINLLPDSSSCSDSVSNFHNNQKHPNQSLVESLSIEGHLEDVTDSGHPTSRVEFHLETHDTKTHVIGGFEAGSDNNEASANDSCDTHLLDRPTQSLHSEQTDGSRPKNCSAEEKSEQSTKIPRPFTDSEPCSVLLSTGEDDITANISLSMFKEFVAKSKNESDTTDIGPHKRCLYTASISPQNNSIAEQQLSKNIKKDDFKRMLIIGQFNLGFIVARLDDDLFIIDQHAADEIYNFEMLQQNTVVKSQKLIRPKVLELSFENQLTIVNNLEVFTKNGYELSVEENEDINELIFLLQDRPEVMCRPSRVRKMFASRACRKAVMVGTALSHREMSTIVGHLSELRHPWVRLI